MGRAVDVIVIGGSAGAIEALGQILPALPPAFGVPVVIVVHVGANSTGLMATVLGAKCALPVRDAEDKEPVDAGVVYLAPAGYHLLFERGRTFALSIDEPVMFSRPSIDVLFESAADAYGAAAAAVLLTGANEDGARGLARIGAAGGLTVAQEPETAFSPTMPAAAVRLARPDHVLPLSALGAFLASLDRP